MIKYFDIFAGIGGFRSGLEKAGGFKCVGYCEIDKYAKKAYETLYDTEGEVFYDDARKIDPNELPDFDLICGGFPCQSFSIAGKRKGFSDTRGTLFFEIARIAAIKKPKYLLLENVPGLLSHNEGRTFATILSTLDELGYDVVWEVLNSADFGVPQSRKRVYIIDKHIFVSYVAACLIDLRQDLIKYPRLKFRSSWQFAVCDKSVNIALRNKNHLNGLAWGLRMR